MPRSEASLRITDAYRTRLEALASRTTTLARREWASLDPFDVDGSYPAWSRRLEAVVSQAQTEGVRLTNAYLTAFLTSELGRRTNGPLLSSRRYAGLSRDGRTLAEAFDSPRIKVKVALKNGSEPSAALKAGLAAALRTVDLDTLHAARQSLSDGLQADDRFTGWRRAVRGTCGACMAVASRTEDAHVHFQVHANCKCVAEPVVGGVPDIVKRPTGSDLFNQKTPEEQDAALGPEAAEAVRNGLPLESLVGTSAMADEPGWITQKPLDEAEPQA